ncbi:MAG: membrane protein insertase YidC, partial [Candidatus Zixiibacteriota bacterium]
MIDKKTLPLIILLVILVLFWFQIMEYLGFYKPARREQPVEQPTVTVDTVQPAQPPPAVATADTAVGERPLDRLPTAEQALDSAEMAPPDTITVITNTYTVLLSSLGGGPVSLKLNKYTYRDSEPIQMLPDANHATPEAAFAGANLSTSQLSFESNKAPGEYRATRDTLELVYSYGEAGQGEIIRRYFFYPDEYHFDLIVEVNNADRLGIERQYRLTWNTPIGVTEPQPEMDYNSMEAVAMMGGSRTDLDDY